MQLRSLPFFCVADVLSVAFRTTTYCIDRRVSPLSAMRYIATQRWQPTASTKSSTGLLKRLESGALVRWILFLVGALPAFVKLLSFSGVPWTQAYGASYGTSFLLIELLLTASAMKGKSAALPTSTNVPGATHDEAVELSVLDSAGHPAIQTSAIHTSHNVGPGRAAPPQPTQSTVAQLAGPSHTSVENIERARRRYWKQVRTRKRQSRNEELLRWLDNLLVGGAAGLHVGIVVFAWMQLLRIRDQTSHGWYSEVPLMPELSFTAFLFGEMGRWDGRRGQMCTGYCVGVVALAFAITTGRLLIADLSSVYHYGSPVLMAFMYLMYQGAFIGLTNVLHYKLPRVAKELLLKPGNLPHKVKTGPGIPQYPRIEENSAANSTSALVFASLFTVLLWYAYRFDPTGTKNPAWTGVFG